MDSIILLTVSHSCHRNKTSKSSFFLSALPKSDRALYIREVFLVTSFYFKQTVCI